jgi:integrase/recombinase XerD
MKLSLLIHQYTLYKKSLGAKFRGPEYCLKSFCRYMGSDIDVSNISAEKVFKFLYGDKPVTLTWFSRHNTLFGFYQYALNRKYINISPLPAILPKRPASFVPYIYTRADLRQLFKTALTYQKRHSHVEPYMIYNILLVLYATGLRLNEALSLSVGDVDLIHAVIIVKETKFYKSRFVPFGAQLSSALNEYVSWRKTKGFPQNAAFPFFYGKDNKSVNMSTVQGIFLRIREKARIKRSDGARYQPRLHDLRHTFAVHRLINWYQKNANVQQLLPLLSVYLGHTHLAATSAYLTITNDVLKEASRRFEEYARKGYADG